MAKIPPCGLYRTLVQIGDVPAGRLVYLHDHGNPGPGIYLPERWNTNRAVFQPRGMTLPPEFDAKQVQALPREGFYRVTKAFHCCAKKCVEFDKDVLVQLGYNGAGRALVFVPELGEGALKIGERGSLVDDAVLVHLAALRVHEPASDISLPRGIVVH